MQDGTSKPIRIGGARSDGFSGIEPEQQSGAFSLDGGSYMQKYGELRHTPHVDINYKGLYDALKLMYTRPARQERERRTLEKDSLSIPDVQKQLKERLLELFQNQTCYDSLPAGSRIVVIDVTLPLHVAFISALENKVPFGILWDPKAAKFVGMMTVSDYIRVVLTASRLSEEGMKDLQATRIEKWREDQKLEEQREQQHAAQSGSATEPLKCCRDFLCARVDQDLLSALSDLHRHKIKRLPVVSQTGEVVSVLSLSVILNIIMTKLSEQQAVRDAFTDLLSYSVRDLGIGTYYGRNDTWPKCRLETKMHDVLHTFMDYNVHCIPILDREDRCLDVFTRNDVMFMEQGGYYNVDIAMAQPFMARPRHPVYCFSPDDTLYEVMQHLNTCGVRQLIGVDEGGKVVGQITLTDIFEWLLSDSAKGAAKAS